MVAAEGVVPTDTTGPCVSTPEAFTENLVTVPSNWLATYRNFPSGVTARPEGPVPLGAFVAADGNGEPGTSVRVLS